MNASRGFFAAVLLASFSVTAAPAMAVVVDVDDQFTPVEGQSDFSRPASPVDGIYVEATANSDGSTTIDAARSLSGTTLTAAPAGQVAAGQSASGYTCVKKTTPDSRLKAYTPTNIDVSTSEWEVHYTDHQYSMSNARYVSGQWTTQFEQCTIGGSKNKTWHRLAHTESEVSIGASQNKRIGAKWGTGVDNGEVTSKIDFSVSAAKAVTISGSLPMTTGGTFQGSIGDGLCGAIGNASGNQVNAAWDYTYPGYGTAKFKGNVGHALYEYPQANKTSFSYYFQACRQRRY